MSFEYKLLGSARDLKNVNEPMMEGEKINIEKHSNSSDRL